MKPSILIVDDESDIRRLIAGVLADELYETREASRAEIALADIEKNRPDAVVLDIWLEGSQMDGLGLLKELHNRYPELPVVMISGHGNIETAVKAIKWGAYDFIEKPFKSDRLLLIVARALEAARLKNENKQLKEKIAEVSELIGESEPITSVRAAIAKAAASSSRVLFAGPPGSGKELAARLLHKHSPQAQGPLIFLNCASMEPERVELELFGQEEAPGQSSRRVGLLEEADGGMLVLDEVADLPLATQGKLVRLLQEQKFFRLGGSQPVEVDVRFVAMSSRDLPQLIADGRLREDLYYRLSVVPILIPPLLRRTNDIPALASYFLEQHCKTLGLSKLQLSEPALQAMQSYTWPGNVRQLKNTLEWLLIMHGRQLVDQKKDIEIRHLPSDIRASLPGYVANEDDVGSDSTAPNLTQLPLREAREQFEKDYLQAQLRQHDYNVSQTAEMVGMDRAALHRKLKALGIDAKAA